MSSGCRIINETLSSFRGLYFCNEWIIQNINKFEGWFLSSSVTVIWGSRHFSLSRGNLFEIGVTPWKYTSTKWAYKMSCVPMNSIDYWTIELWLLLPHSLGFTLHVQYNMSNTHKYFFEVWLQEDVYTRIIIYFHIKETMIRTSKSHPLIHIDVLKAKYEAHFQFRFRSKLWSFRPLRSRKGVLITHMHNS